MGRYDARIQAILPELEAVPSGFVFLQAPPGEQKAVAESIPTAVLGTLTTLEEVSRPVAGPQTMTLVGLGGDRNKHSDLLRELDARREWLSLSGRRLLVIADPAEMRAIESDAGAMFSARRYDAVIGFEPDEAVDEEAALAELQQHLHAKLGRLDLRGFVRSESEDVSFPVEAIFQEPTVLRAGAELAGLDGEFGGLRAAVARGRLPLMEAIQDAIASDRRAFVLLGHPGTGKSFFLRWLALKALREGELFGLPRPVPVLLSLSAFARSPAHKGILEHAAESWLEEGLLAAHVLSRSAAAGRVVFLLDGLDEASDPAGHARVREALRDLRAPTSKCLMVLTSRVAGYEPDLELGPVELRLAPFDEKAIKGFLAAWCALYAIDRLGNTDVARAEGKREGEELSRSVMEAPAVRGLAENPLLLTILAIVHRAGVRLPDHRVELYDHATRILVERWNRVRSADGGGDAAPPPLKSADAARLLGPLALRAIQSGIAGAIPIDVVRAELESVLGSRSLRSLATPDEALRLFTETLGLLVEQGPGQFAFLHLTLAEYFAAWELVRSTALEEIAADPERAFSPKLKEVLLLATGILGVIRADDERLSSVLDKLIASARAVAGSGVMGVPAVLGGILADDPILSEEQARSLVEVLVPQWWFEAAEVSSLHEEACLDWVRNAAFVVRGAHGSLLRGRLAAFYGCKPSRWGATGSSRELRRLAEMLRRCGFDPSPQISLWLNAFLSGSSPWMEDGVFLSLALLDRAWSTGTVQGRVPRLLDQEVREKRLPLGLILRLGTRASTVVPWAQTRIVQEDSTGRWLELPSHDEHRWENGQWAELYVVPMS
ncbi:MAG: NACHT domain-containing protein [Polyangiaceae bacterium]